MARRTGEALSPPMGLSAEGGVNREESERESWLSRSTVCANDEEDSDDSDAEECGWSELHTPAPINVGNSTEKSTTQDSAAKRGEVYENQRIKSIASISRKQRGKRQLPSLRGFSGVEALQTKLPRTGIKRTQLERTCNIARDGTKTKKAGRCDAKLVAQTLVSVTMPSIEEVQANRRKWDLERKLQDNDRQNNPLASMKRGEARGKGSKPRLPTLNPVVPSVSAVEANRQKWDLERRLQDSDKNGIPARAFTDHGVKRNLKRKLPTLNPTTPSVGEVEDNLRKWNLERKLQDLDHCGSLSAVEVHDENLDAKRKLPSLNSAIPTISIRNQNWPSNKLERKLNGHHCASVDTGRLKEQTQAHRNKFCGVNAHNRVYAFVSIVIGWLQRCTMNSPRDDLANKKRQQCNSVGNSSSAGEWGMPNGFQISMPLSFLILFSSTAALHSAVFTFNSELRVFLGIDGYPVSLLLLVSWVLLGMVSILGGIFGDVVQNRILWLQRTVVVWSVALVSLHAAAYQVPSQVSSVSLVLGFSCASVGYGFLSTNIVALRMQYNFSSRQAIQTPLSSEEGDQSDNDSSESDGYSGGESDNDSNESESDSGSSESCYSDEDCFTESEILHSLTGRKELANRQCDVQTHKFFRGCFAAKMAGSSLMQGYYIIVVDVNALTDEESEASASSQGFHCMLLMSFLLMASLVYFCYKSWDYRLTTNNLQIDPPDSTEERFQRKLAGLEQGFADSDKTIVAWCWSSILGLFNRAIVGYALLAFVVMIFIGAGISVGAMFMSRVSVAVRLVAFLLILFGWLFTMIASSRQLNPKKRCLVREGRRLGFRARQLYLALFSLAFICVSGCVAFLRAQLYTTMVVQVCQTRLLIPGTDVLFDPELLGTTVGASSLFLLALVRAFTKSTTVLATSPESLATKAGILGEKVPTTPMHKTCSQSLSLQILPDLASCAPITRMCLAVLLYLSSIFLLSIVELYRRKAGVTPSVPARSCGSIHSEFTFLWTLPHLVLLGASDVLFRVSLQEECHELAQHSFAPKSSRLTSRRWTGTIQGVISLAEALGYTTALAFTAVLSEWLFHPEPRDMALLFLLLTAVVALTYALLKRIAARVNTHEQSYQPATFY